MAKLTRALEQAGDDPDLWFNRGLAQHAAKRYAAAIDDYSTALALPGADRTELVQQLDLCRVALAEKFDSRFDPTGHQSIGAR